MTITNKILPIIALGLASMLSVCNAGVATWQDDSISNTSTLRFDDTNATATEDKTLTSSWNIISVGATSASYSGSLTTSSGISTLDIEFEKEGARLEFLKPIVLNSGLTTIVLNKGNTFSAFGSNSTSSLYGVVLNGGVLAVDIYSSKKSNFSSDITFNRGEACFSFDNLVSGSFGFKEVGGSISNSVLYFNAQTNSGKATFEFADSNSIALNFIERAIGSNSTISNTKANEDVLLNFNGSNNRISLSDDFTNMKIVFKNTSSNNVLLRGTYGSSSDIRSIRWVENYGTNNTIVAFSSPLDTSSPLTIDSIKSGADTKPLNFILGVNLEYSQPIANKLTIKSGSGTHNLGVYLVGASDFNPTTSLLIASVVNGITLNPIDGYVSGFVLSKVEYEIAKGTDENGGDSNTNYTSYYIKSAKNVGVAPVNQSITSSALALNYDLFIGNFNSLNKRMGELRDDPYSQGGWTRVFNGQISNDFSGSKNNYTTIQMGYDHKLGEFENASNYLGASVSYLLGLSDQHSIDSSSAYLSRSIKDVISNGVEIALYNSYVQDEGWFSDSIAKFSYLASDFNILDNTNNTSEKQSTSNIAFTLGEEFGYRFKLGESKAWYLDPQVEMALGYFSGTDLKQVAGNDYLDAKSDSMLMFRARVGTAVGYDFKDFTADKDFNAKLYVGLSYEADFVSGGDVTLTPNNGNAMSVASVFSSDGRGVLNVGTNVKIKEQTRVYADIQTSFGGKITNDYQVNFGVRYSFGESASKEALKTKQD